MLTLKIYYKQHNVVYIVHLGRTGFVWQDLSSFDFYFSILPTFLRATGLPLTGLPNPCAKIRKSGIPYMPIFQSGHAIMHHTPLLRGNDLQR